MITLDSRLKFQFSAEYGAGDAIIRYLTNSTIAHVDLVLPRKVLAYAFEYMTFQPGFAPRDLLQYEWTLLGARLDGVKIRPPYYARFKTRITASCGVMRPETAYSFALQQVGKPYNRKAIWDMILHRHRQYHQQQHAWFCDELAYAVAKAGGTTLVNALHPMSLTPQEVLLSPLLKRENSK